MSVSSTNSSHTLSLQQYSSVQLTSAFKFTDFLHNLFLQLSQAGVQELGLSLDKTNKMHPVVVTHKAVSSEIALAIDKVCSLIKRNLGFLINLSSREMAETPKLECCELIERCKNFAIRLNLAENLEKLEKLEKEINRISDLMNAKEKFFLYRVIGTDRSVLAFMSDRRDPSLIKVSKNFWRRCIKADYIEFTEMWGDQRGRILEHQDLSKLFKQLAFSLTSSVPAHQEAGFSLNAGLRVVKPVWRFIKLHSSSIEDNGVKVLSEVTRHAFLQVLEFLLYPRRHPISWDSSVGLWDTAKKLRIDKLKDECLLWLKREMERYTSYPKDMQNRIFDRVMQWHQDVLAMYGGYPYGPIYRKDYQEFFANIVQSAESFAEFATVLDRLIEKNIELDRLRFSSRSSLSQFHYKKLSTLPELKELFLEGVSLFDEEVKILATLKLIEFSFDDARQLTEDGFWHLSKMTTLKKMTVKKLPAYLTDAGLCFLSCLPLQSIDLRGCVLLTNAGLSSLKSRIKELSFGGSKYLTPSVLTDLARLPLEKLTLVRVPGLRTEDLTGLDFFKDLTSLELIESYPQRSLAENLQVPRITDPVLPLLAATSPRLTCLRLENVSLTNRGMSFFSSLPSLQKLTLSRIFVSTLGSVTNLSNLTHLGLLECSLINGRSLRALTSLGSLQLLEIVGKGIEEESLPDIFNLTQLTSLNLTGCTVSNTQTVRDCLAKASKLEILKVSNLFFNLFRQIALGTSVIVSTYDLDQPLPDLTINKNELWKVIVGTKERIPLEYFSLLLREDAKEWMPKITQELKNRVSRKLTFVSEDFQKALDLMSYALDQKNLDLAISLLELFFRPKAFGYDTPREPDKIHELDANMFHWLHRWPVSGPNPLEVIDCLNKKQRVFVDKERKNIVSEVLVEYKALLPPVNEQEIASIEISNKYPDVSLAFSNLLARLVVMQLSGAVISPLLTALCTKLNEYYALRVVAFASYDVNRIFDTNQGLYYDWFGEEHRIGATYENFIVDSKELISLIIFSRKYALGLLENCSSMCLMRHLSSNKDWVSERAFKDVLEILIEAKLFKLDPYAYADVQPWLLHLLESEERLEIHERKQPKTALENR